MVTKLLTGVKWRLDAALTTAVHLFVHPILKRPEFPRPARTGHHRRQEGAGVTQYYEPEARRLESLANQSNDPAEQNRLWTEAARIGTVVEWCLCGLDEVSQGAKFCKDCTG